MTIERLLKIDKGIEWVQTALSILLFTAILVLGSIQVVGRYVLASAPPWTEEAMRFCGIYLTFVGSSLTVMADAHVSVDLLIGFIKNNRIRAMLFVVARMICVVFLILFLPASVDLVRRSTSFLSASMQIPYSYVYLAAPLGIIMMLCSYASAIPRLSKKYREGEL